MHLGRALVRVHDGEEVGEVVKRPAERFREIFGAKHDLRALPRQPEDLRPDEGLWLLGYGKLCRREHRRRVCV